MNKTTYANFHGVVNVFLGGDCVQKKKKKSALKCVSDEGSRLAVALRAT